jgi:hypothetical protein
VPSAHTPRGSVYLFVKRSLSDSLRMDCHWLERNNVGRYLQPAALGWHGDITGSTELTFIPSQEPLKVYSFSPLAGSVGLGAQPPAAWSLHRAGSEAG